LGGAALAALAAAACGGMGDEATGDENLGHESLLSTLEPVNELPTDYVHVPGGIVLHKSCVHEIPDGAEVDADERVTLRGVQVAKHARCNYKAYRSGGPLAGSGAAGRAGPQPPSTGGWVETSWANSTQAMFTHMDSGYFTVPPNPSSNHGQLLYFFPSLENNDSIVQPVLQWGDSPAPGDGQMWKFTNWRVTCTGVAPNRVCTSAFGTLKSATAGDILYGSMDITAKSASSQTWTVSATNNTTITTATNTFTFATTGNFNSAQAGVLEAYNVADCHDFPNYLSGSTYFSFPTLKQGNSYTDRTSVSPTWTTYNYQQLGYTNANCNFSVSVTSNGSTTLNY
jgi:hypothetical protein